jgi:single stranded DNA-binding protein
LPSGTAVANVHLAESYTFTDANKQKREHTNWHSLSFYGVLTDVAAPFAKGDNLFVDGTLQWREFTPTDGSKRKVAEAVVRSCHLIEKPHSSKNRAADDNSPDTAPAPPPVTNEDHGNDDFWQGTP